MELISMNDARAASMENVSTFDVLRSNAMDVIQKQIAHCEFHAGIYEYNTQAMNEVKNVTNYTLELMEVMGYSDAEIVEIRNQFDNIIEEE